MDKRDYLIILLLFVLGIITRVPFVERLQSHWDGPQWSIGIIRYSLQQETPVAPGYPLYIALGKIMNLFTNDPHKSLILISVLFSGIGASLFYITGKKFFNSSVGLISSLLYLSGPTFYFFGLTAYPYGLLSINSTIFALVVFYIVVKQKQWGSVVGILFAYVLGIRPQEFIFLFPLFLFALYYLSQKQIRFAFISLVICFLIWFIPLVSTAGGIFEYSKITSEFAKKGALPNPAILRMANDYLMIIKGLFLSFSLGSIFFIFYFFELKNNFNRKYILSKFRNKSFVLFCLWILPSLIFNIFVRSDHAGHQMTYLSGLLILTAYSIWFVFKKNQNILIFVVILVTCFNLWWFFRDRDPQFRKPYVPTSFHYSEIRKNDIRLSAKIKYIRSNFQPKDTIIITSLNLWRPIMYYLSEFLIYDIPGITNDEEKFRYVVRISKNWNFEEEIDKNFSFHIPLGYHNLIFADDESGSWNYNKPIKKVILNGNGMLTIINVKEYDNFLYKKGMVTQL